MQRPFFTGRASPSSLFSLVFSLLCPPDNPQGTNRPCFMPGFLVALKAFKILLKTGFQQVFTPVSTFPHFPVCCVAHSGGTGKRDSRFHAWPIRIVCTAPAAPSVLRRKAFPEAARQYRRPRIHSGAPTPLRSSPPIGDTARPCPRRRPPLLFSRLNRKSKSHQ